MIGNVSMTIETEKASTLFISAVWLVMVVTVNPIGDFPLNDDWAFAASVGTLVAEKQFVFPDWSAPNFVAQAIWGWLFSSVFGFSFTTLRFSVLVLGLIGVIAAFKLSREIGVPTLAALLGAMALIVNPIYFSASNTFMTDVPFFAFSALALLFLTKAINDDKGFHIALGTVAAGLALLTRQVGLAIPLAYAIAYLTGREIMRETIFRAFFPLLVCISLQMLFRMWLQITDQMPTMYGHQINQVEQILSLSILNIAKIYGDHAVKTCFYLGLFVSPVLLWVLFCRHPKIPLAHIALSIVGALLAWAILLAAGMPDWPLLGNQLEENGIGPFFLNGSVGYRGVSQIQVSMFWTWIGILSTGFTGLMFAVLLRRGREAWFAYRSKNFVHARTAVLFWAVTLIYFVPVLGVERVFDRYLLLPILTVIQIIFLSANWQMIAKRPTGPDSAIVIFITVSSGVLTTMATHDYLAWNRVRWAALNDLVHVKGVSPTKIDGGFEFNGMYLYSKGEIKEGHKGWWVVDNEYLLAYTPERLVRLEGYKVEAKYPVDAYLSISPKNIFVLRRP